MLVSATKVELLVTLLVALLDGAAAVPIASAYCKHITMVT